MSAKGAVTPRERIDALERTLREIRADMPVSLGYGEHYLRQWIDAWAAKIDRALPSPAQHQSQSLNSTDEDRNG